MNAGFWIRLGASLLDGIIIGIPLAIISLLFTGGNEGRDYFTDVVSFLYSLLVPVFWSGYTIGKRICGVQIRKLDGSPPGIGTMLLRNVVGGLVYGLTLGIAVIVSAFMVGLREDKRAIHDFIAGTEVVHSD
ncbi:RDD family protein [Paenibacillus sp. FSL K6-3182]|uniref:RDD family protein n=1 Tax=unclassified Paenibacillus TaxID=185978 RepID=UPI0030D52889